MKELSQKYFDTLKVIGYSNNTLGIQFYLENLFLGIDFKNKNVLDIGGGFGLLSFYAAVKGACNVTCLEPESSGSTSGVQQKFETIAGILGLENVFLKCNTFQELPMVNEKYDIIISHNSINHLDEHACINLLNDESSKSKYRDIFKKLSDLANQNANLIICDCSRYNLYASLRLRNPFSPTIEWHKHQTPETWSKMLKKAGFAVSGIRWKNNDRGIYQRRIFEVSKIKSFFLHSHFCINAIKI